MKNSCVKNANGKSGTDDGCLKHNRMYLLEAKDGTKGWIRVEKFKIPSLDNKTVYEVFDGLNMVD